MYKIAVVLIALLGLSALALAQNPKADKITHLPLWKGELGNQYSGYITVAQGASTRRLHYWFIEASKNAAIAPVVLWLNGGPGCSSLDGLFYELGPIHFDQSSTLSLVPNPYAWTQLANIIFLEAPAGVGFSTWEGTEPQYNDTGVAADNYAALLKWFAAYPQFQKNDFWIAGESYAGVYVPSLAALVLQGSLKSEFPAPFKGVMVGNGVANADGDNLLNDPVAFMVGHGLISPAQYAEIVAACPDPNNPSAQCNNLFNQAMNNLNNINIYDIYADCYHQRTSKTGSPPCIDSDFARQYLNRPDVQEALHVEKTNWEICNFDINNNYDRTPNSMVPIYKTLLAHKLRVLIYSGDTDFAVPFTGTAYWTSNMGLTVTGQPWRQWNFKDALGTQVAGYVTDYAEGLTFATIKGAGHMVPQFKPIPALVMFQKFITGQKL